MHTAVKVVSQSSSMADKGKQVVNMVLANIDDVLNQYLSLSDVKPIRLIWGQETHLNELYIYTNMSC